MSTVEHLKNICGTDNRLSLLLSAGNVCRYHQEGRDFVQHVNEHTWRLLVILLHFWPDSSRNLIVTALFHDVPERLTGDTPATVKVGSPDMVEMLRKWEEFFYSHVDVPSEANLSTEEYTRLKCADYLELCITMRRRSDRRGAQIFEKGSEYVLKLAGRLESGEDRERVVRFLDEIETGAWRE